MTTQRQFTFAAGDQGAWQIEGVAAVRGESLAPAPRLGVFPGLAAPAGAAWALPAVARRLHHCRDLADPAEPFDFLTWFEFAPEHEAAFDELLARLRASEEWEYVEREAEVRLVRVGA